jgi:C-terminal processing protease CtpA/Prc
LYLQVREQYLKNEPMVNRAQTYAAIRKLVASLDDPFTRFLEPDRLAALKLGTTGTHRTCLQFCPCTWQVHGG